MNVSRLIIIVFFGVLCACSGAPEPTAAERVNSIASQFVAGYYSLYPEEAYESAYPDAPMDRFGDHSDSRLAARDKQVDGWLEDLDALDPTALSGTFDAVTYLFARERLQGIVERRVCRMELWNVSPTWTRWPSTITSTLGAQPVGTADEQDAALARASDISRYLDTAIRSQDSAFGKRYRDFLATEYPGRDVVGVSGNPDGEACYAASVRYWSSLPMDAADIHRAGLSNMSRIQSEQAMLDYINSAVARARGAMPDWFAYVPDSKLIVRPSPAFEKDSGGGFYSAASPDGSVGIYKVGTYNPTGISKAGTESTAFHEGWPGHHLDSSIAAGNPSLHPILRYMWSSGSSEGWALYSERLADEIGLYSSELARLGMLSNEAFRAARLVVDPGMHVMGWTRQDAIDYMLENTAEGFDAVSGEVDRYAAVPGQATSYLAGSLEIQRLRQKAERLLGDRFDIRVFHNRILENGSVTLPMLGISIDAWIDETLAE